MTLIANSAVTVGGKSYRPGDIIDCSAVSASSMSAMQFSTSPPAKCPVSSV